MSDTIKGVMTKDGVKPIDYRALANLPTIDSTPTNKSTNAIQSGAVYTALTGKLGTTAQAADSAKLGGKSPDYYAKADHSHSAGEIAGGVLSVAKGGTGATTAEDALKNLGAMPTSGGKFTGSITFAEGADIINEDGQSLLETLTYLGTTLGTTTTTANNAKTSAADAQTTANSAQSTATDAKTKIDTLITDITAIKYVTALPSNPDSKTLYLIKK